MNNKQTIQTLSIEFLSQYCAENIPHERGLVDIAVEEYLAREGDRLNMIESVPSGWEGMNFSPSDVEIATTVITQIVVPFIANIISNKPAWKAKKEKVSNLDKYLQEQLEAAASPRLGSKNAKKLSKAFLKWLKEHPELLIS